MPAPGYGGKKMFIIDRRENTARGVWKCPEGTWPWARSYEETAGVGRYPGLVAKRAKGKRAGFAKKSEFCRKEQLGKGQTSPWAGESRVVGGVCWPGGPYYK